MLYNFAIYFYLLGVAIASLFNEKVRKMWRGERAAFDVLKQKVDPEAKYVWFHAASLGEFEQGRPIMERLRSEHPEYKILLTFFSPSGYEVRKNYEGADIICYLPLDTPINAIRFLRLVRPVMAFFIKYEFWYNYLHILKYRKVPTYSVSSIFRPEQVFFKWYAKKYAGVLRCITHFFVQNEQSRELLEKIGITEVTISGDTRFDRVLQIKEQSKRLPLVEAFKNKKQTVEEAYKQEYKVFVAGSSWPPDEDIFIRFFNEHPEWKLIIAPHVIGNDHLQQIMSKLNRKTVRYTEATPETAAEAQCMIIDCFGLLSSIYHYGEVAYVGGGFGVGIHNVLEAAVWNVPVFFGPNNKRFQEAQQLLASGGAVEITDYNSFDSAMTRFMNDEKWLKECGSKAGEYVKSKAGATDIVLKESLHI
ncbi:MAG: glycosyltransferase N-terminal domain-containing protein [Prevotella sp.]|nr:glycosyltransferase N-terminal domain-containing protein [Prevotellaceae bacterium]MDY4627729.1 glycosyltransferase N-terminal domain-containing protein [Prevotella sp.]MDY5343176.1 glycosyltransferase N-terminal domain-containing protein [Prevotella sp.]